MEDDFRTTVEFQKDIRLSYLEIYRYLSQGIYPNDYLSVALVNNDQHVLHLLSILILLTKLPATTT